MAGSPTTRVLWLAKGLGPGGMERLLVNHALFGDGDRFEYHAAYLVDRPSSVVGELEAAGVRCHPLGRGRTLDPKWVVGLRALLVRERFDIVHAHSPLPAAVARIVARTVRPRPCLVYTEHNSWDCYGGPTRVANGVTYWLDDAQLAVSREAAASVPKVLRNRLEVLTHGIDLAAVRAHLERRAETRDALGIDESMVLVATIANLRVEKAYDVLLAAAARVVTSRDDVVFLGVGHGQLESEIRQLHDELGLGERLRLLGFRRDALDLLAASDVFLLSSRQEGLPVALMEAMALGLPVVSTAVGGVPDYVVDGVNGRLVPPERADLLADAVCELASDPDRREQLGAASRERSTAFDAAVAVGRLDAVYSGLLD